MRNTKPYKLYEMYKNLSPYAVDLHNRISDSTKTKQRPISLSLKEIRRYTTQNCDIQDRSFYTNLIPVLYCLGFKTYKTEIDNDICVILAERDSNTYNDLPDFHKTRINKLTNYLIELKQVEKLR